MDLYYAHETPELNMIEIIALLADQKLHKHAIKDKYNPFNLVTKNVTLTQTNSIC